MPLVDYRCEPCTTTHEVFTTSPVPEAIACPLCGGPARRRFGLGGLLGVRPARGARERLDRERAMQPKDQRHQSHHHHDHDHDGHHHGHGHDHSVADKEDQP
jgi:putative FmdB family regulatory protein